VTTKGLHVDHRGEGPPVVFSHGFASSSATWAAQMDALAADLRLVAWDLRGHGRSAAPEGLYRREDALADLAAVVGLAAGAAGRPVLLVGHSLGGYLSLLHTIERPDTVAGLVLISTGPGFRNAERRESYNRLMEKAAARHGLPSPVTEVALQKDSLVMDRLDAVGCPTLVLIGADDHEMYRAGSRYLAERLPRAELVDVSGAGHDVHVDRPEAFTEFVRTYARPSTNT